MNAPDSYLRNGILYDMPADEYHAEPAVSNSMLSDLRRSPRHCYALHLAADKPVREPTASMRFGTMAHCVVLEPAKFHQRYAVKPQSHDGRTKEGKAWAAEHAGREIISAEESTAATRLQSAVYAVPELAHALSSGRAEVSVFWTDERTGLRCRARPDWLHRLPDGRLIVVDLKTTSDASPTEFARSVWTYGYHRQEAFYKAGLTACGEEVAAFLFAAVTNAHPFIAVPYVLDDDAVMRGAAEVRDLIDLFAECKRTNEWPAYGSGVQVLSLPAWAK